MSDNLDANDSDYESGDDVFANLTAEDWAAVDVASQVAPPSTSINLSVSQPEETSDEYDDDIYRISDSDLRQLDALERNSVQVLLVPSATVNLTVAGPSNANVAQSSTSRMTVLANSAPATTRSNFRPASLKRSAPSHTPLGSSPKRIKGKDKENETLTEASELKATKRIYEMYEEELNCPICYDLFTSSHTLCPCGHSLCGSCAYHWLTRNTNNWTCPICRSKVSGKRPVVRNLAMDNMTARHVDVLAKLDPDGDSSWAQPDGKKYTEWSQKNKCHKDISKKLRSKAKDRNPNINFTSVLVDLFSEVAEETEAIVL